MQIAKVENSRFTHVCHTVRLRDCEMRGALRAALCRRGMHGATPHTRATRLARGAGSAPGLTRVRGVYTRTEPIPIPQIICSSTQISRRVLASLRFVVFARAPAGRRVGAPDRPFGRFAFGSPHHRLQRTGYSALRRAALPRVPVPVPAATKNGAASSSGGSKGVCYGSVRAMRHCAYTAAR